MNSATIGIIASSRPKTIPSGLTDLTNWNNTISPGITITGNSATFDSDVDTCIAVANHSFPAGQPFIIQMDGQTEMLGGSLCLADNAGGQTGLYLIPFIVTWGWNSPGNGGFYCEASSAQYGSAPVDYSGTPLGRIRGDGTNVYIECSFDAGDTWSAVGDSPVFDQPDIDLWPQMWFDHNPTAIVNVKTDPGLNS